MKTLRVPMVGVIVLALLGMSAPSIVTAQEEADPTAAIEAQRISEQVMAAWATGAAVDIEAIYDPAVVMVIDEEVYAVDRAEITGVIRRAIGVGNTYEQVGPVIGYLHTSGDTFVATLVEVRGRGHPKGDPVVGFYRVHEGKVTRHVVMDAEHY